MPLIQVNLHSATTEELFERQAWFYATVNQAQTYDAEGHGHPLSVRVDLSRGNLPFQPRFALQNYLVQKQAFLQSLKVQIFAVLMEIGSDTGEFLKVCLTNV